MTSHALIQKMILEEADRLDALIEKYERSRCIDCLTEIGASITLLNKLESMSVWTIRARVNNGMIGAAGEWTGGGGGSSGGGASGGW